MALTEKRKAYLKQWRLKNLEKNRKKQRNWQKEWRIKNPEMARKKDKEKHEKFKEREKIYSRNYARLHKKDPLKYKARSDVNNAIKLGKITRPDLCEACKEVGLIQAHHDDYLKPLEVRWLCVKCHANHHHQKALDDLLASLDETENI